jgi:hypothetical protein
MKRKKLCPHGVSKKTGRCLKHKRRAPVKRTPVRRSSGSGSGSGSFMTTDPDVIAALQSAGCSYNRVTGMWKC